MALRVLYAAPALPPDVGGIEMLAAELLPRLRDDHGIEVHCVTQYGLVSRHDRSGFAGLPVDRIGEAYGLVENDPGRILRGIRRIRAIIDTFRPDVLNINSLDPLTWMIAQARPARPVLLTLHNSEEPLRAEPVGRSLIESHGTGLIAVSRAVERHAIAMFPSLAGRSDVIPNAMSLPPVAIEPFPAEPLLFFAGRMESQKGADVAVAAMPQVLAGSPQARLEMAGGGLLEQQVAAQITALGLDARVTMLGRIPRIEVLRRMARSSLVLVPSRNMEGFSLAALEAAQMGRPVIGSRLDGLPETVADGETGLLVEPERPDALARAVLRVLADPALQARLGAAGRERALRDHSPATMAAAYADAFRRAALARV